jgi:hypothetical protein
LTGGGGLQLLSSEYTALLALFYSLLVGSSGGGCERRGQFIATGDPLLTSISNLRKERKKGNLKYMFKACLI